MIVYWPSSPTAVHLIEEHHYAQQLDTTISALDSANFLFRTLNRLRLPTGSFTQVVSSLPRTRYPACCLFATSLIFFLSVTHHIT